MRKQKVYQYKNNSGMDLRGIRMDRTKLILIALIKKLTVN